MPMNFPDMKSLVAAAKVHNFRQPNDGETEEQFRQALADHVAPIDFIESQEIRTSKGWDKWNESEGLDMLARAFDRNKPMRSRVWYPKEGRYR